MDSLTTILKELIEPDPTLRGDKRSRQQVGNPVGVERFQPRFKQMQLQAEILERTKKS